VKIARIEATEYELLSVTTIFVKRDDRIVRVVFFVRKKAGRYPGIFCDYSIKPYVPRVWRNFLNCLAIKCRANQLRAQPVTPVLQKRKTAIVIPATHSNLMVLIVEGNNRCDDEINRTRRNIRLGNWLPNAEKFFSSLVSGEIYRKIMLPRQPITGAKTRFFARHARSMTVVGSTSSLTGK